MAGRAKSAPAAFVDALVQVEGNLRPTLAAQPLAVQSGADHARVVEDERIPGAEQVGEVADDVIPELDGVPLPPCGEGLGVRGIPNRRVFPPSPTLPARGGRELSRSLRRGPHHQQPRSIARDGGGERDALLG